MNLFGRSTDGRHRKERRGVELLSAFGLVVITGSAVGALAYRSVIVEDGTATSSLAILATAGMSGLLVLAGARSRNAKEDQPPKDESARYDLP